MSGHGLVGVFELPAWLTLHRGRRWCNKVYTFIAQELFSIRYEVMLAVEEKPRRGENLCT